ncbi:MAG: hypothetical protein JNJ49_17180 [Bdellovibrionaceae bacterium]|nr:hypothetical protein [Pseudobdellovibrionaceae bacterium]
MNSTATFSIITALTVLAIGALVQRHRFHSWLKAGETALRQAKRPHSLSVTTSTLPLVVQNYLRLAVKNSQERFHHVEFKQTGRFWLKAEGSGLPFSAQQVMSIGQPGFSWTAKIEMPPFHFIVCDRLIDDIGALEAKLLGIVSIASGGGDLLRGELLRYLAEIPWAPLTILQDTELRWREIDSRTVEVRRRVGEVDAGIELHFNTDGLIDRTLTQERVFNQGDRSRQVPWEGRFSNYTQYGDFLIPQHGEVSWLLENGPFTYFKGDITSYNARSILDISN